jgi:hypothetical protein
VKKTKTGPSTDTDSLEARGGTPDRRGAAALPRGRSCGAPTPAVHPDPSDGHGVRRSSRSTHHRPHLEQAPNLQNVRCAPTAVRCGVPSSPTTAAA